MPPFLFHTATVTASPAPLWRKPGARATRADSIRVERTSGAGHARSTQTPPPRPADRRLAGGSRPGRPLLPHLSTIRRTRLLPIRLVAWRQDPPCLETGETRGVRGHVR